MSGIFECPADFLSAQLDCVFEDIFPDAVKTGMLFSAPLINAAACKLEECGAANIVVAPVMVSAFGDSLISPDAAAALKERLFPLATLITPNIPEAEVLSGMKINGKDDMEAAARAMRDEFGCAVLLKGGHSAGDADDLLCSGAGLKWFCAARVENLNTHGTGCTLSSAIAASPAYGDRYARRSLAAKSNRQQSVVCRLLTVV